MERNVAKVRRHRFVAAWAGAALLLSGCASADEPGGAAEAAEASESAPSESSPAEAPAVESECSDGVTAEWHGTPKTTDGLTAIKVAQVAGDGGISVGYTWDRSGEAGAKAGSGADEAQQALLADATAGGLIAIDPAPKVADPVELLEGRDQGRYVLFAYAKRTEEKGTVSCAGGDETVEAADVTAVSFETVQTGVANCADDPDPIAEFAAAEAIGTYCERG